MRINTNETASPFPRALVLGAGPSGLAAAWELARGGARVRVLESQPSTGGLCASVERDGFRFDLGGHRVLTRDHALARRMQELLGDDLLLRERKSIILWAGRAVRYPLEAGDLARNLPLGDVARALASFCRARLRPSGGDRTFEDWVERRFGRFVYERFFRPYTERLWGLPAAQLSADWARERISLVDLWDAALRAVRLRRREVPRTYARRYFYPRRGMGQLFDAFAADVTALGAEILTGTEAAGLEIREGRVRAVLDTAGRRHPCDLVVSTMPLPALACLADPTPAVRAHAGALRFRGMRFLNIALAQPDFSDATWSYLAVDGAAVTRVQEPRRRSPEMAPPGQTSLILECPCDPGDDVWSMDDGALLARGLAELAAAGRPVRPERVLWSFSVRSRTAYPVYALGYDEHRAALLAHLAIAATNLRTAGRQGAFRYVNMETAMLMGIEAARQLLGGAPEAARIHELHRDSVVSELLAVTA